MCGTNHSNWADDKYDQMLLAANKTVDPTERMSKLREAEAYAIEQQPMLPIYIYTKSSMVKPYIKGFFDNDMDRHQWKYLRIDEAWYDGKPESEEADVAPPMIPLEQGEG